MKILHVLNELKFSGAEIMYVDAASYFQALGTELSVVATGNEQGEYASYFKKAKYTVYHMPYPNSGIVRKWIFYHKFIKFLEQNHFDVVHIHRAELRWGISYCAWRAKCKSIYTFHNVFKSNWYSYLFHRWNRWSAKHMFGCKFQTISNSVYTNELKYYHNPTSLVFNWYGSNRFFPAREGEKKEIRRLLNLSQHALVLISVGGCSPIKRHTDIIKALPEIILKFPDTVYLHLGSGTSLNEEIELAQRLNVSAHIRFCGNQSDVRKYLIASDIYLMTSLFEGIPITTIECLACGTPAILYDVPGLRDFNQEKECSVLINEDYHLLADTVLSLLNDPIKQQDLIRNGLDLVHSKYDMKKNASEIYKLYQ